MARLGRQADGGQADDAQDCFRNLGSCGSRQLDCKRRGNSREPTRGEGLHGEPGKQGRLDDRLLSGLADQDRLFNRGLHCY